MSTLPTPRPLPVPERPFSLQIYFKDALPIEWVDRRPTTRDSVRTKRPARPDYVSSGPPVVKRDKDDEVAVPFATSDAPKPPKPGDPKATPTWSSSTNNAFPLPTNFAYSSPTNSAQDASASGGLGTGSKIGIGIGAACVAIFFLIAGFFFLRRRKALKQLSTAKTVYDEEGASKTERPEVWAHTAPPGVAEMAGEKMVPELASPVVPVEAVGDHSHPAELPGSEILLGNVQKEKGDDERLFGDSPIEPDNRSEIEARLINRKEIGS
ncbi:CFEM domain-containing [Pyrenophora seminiperda CCB06]|uniref:CFEM domain-containing n=1 Tax=Pyrenophora seminiperda CCB06 TaxID=1302712 RepID=A0A3M7M549_9PLEO|nr:CFEM domain-containing [Pyrenophora seminiperda CCB06]